MKAISPTPEDEIIHNSLFNGLRIFQEPQPGHYYILTADPKQDGMDKIGLHVVDVTGIPFVQVASANLNESFMSMPGRVYDLGTYYNNAMVIQENNVEASLINILQDQYEYEGEIYKERATGGKFKKILGIRTTTKTKKMMLSSLKKFIENGHLIIKDRFTQDELFNFIEKKNGTFSADDGYHDDLVMSLALVFAPFFDIKNWDNFKGFNDYLENKQKEQEEQEQDTMEFLNLGFNPDYEEEVPFTEELWNNDFNSYDTKSLDDYNEANTWT
jgi:hypothetical protein